MNGDETLLRKMPFPTRAERLAAALRENLRRRKVQARDRAKATKERISPDKSVPDREKPEKA
jgi:hypothetical protein